MVGSILSPPPLVYATGLFSFPLPIHAISDLHPKLFLNGTVGTPFCTKQSCIKRATFFCRVLHSEIYVSCNFSLLCGQCYLVIHNSEIEHLCCFLCEKTPPPLDVPLSIITCMPDIDHQGGELEWDELEAATTFADTFWGWVGMLSPSCGFHLSPTHKLWNFHLSRHQKKRDCTESQAWKTGDIGHCIENSSPVQTCVAISGVSAVGLNWDSLSCLM
jgi:hypothetical protein